MDQALFQENERLTPAAHSRRILATGPLSCEMGGRLEQVDIAWEAWGELNADRSNAILVCHALSGDSHAVGWWERLAGPGRALDTRSHFVIGVNALGGCQGSTGPGSLDQDGRRLGSRFPEISVGDMVDVQARLLDHLGIAKLKLVCGGSMGGLQALEWSVRHPGRVKACWATASCRAHSAMQIGFNEAARQAVLRDPKWLGGDFDPSDPPNHGLAVGRMIGHLSYLSESAFQQKFGREVRPNSGGQFQVESYLNYQGDKFTSRFDAGSLIALSSAIDRYSLSGFQASQARYLFTSFSSDWLYPPHQSRELAAMAAQAGREAVWHNIDLPYGHDAFLLDGDIQGGLVKDFLLSL